MCAARRCARITTIVTAATSQARRPPQRARRSPWACCCRRRRAPGGSGKGAAAAAEAAEVLFESYAASWLSLVSQRRLDGAAAAAAADSSNGGGGGAGGGGVRLDPLSREPCCLPPPGGSRLPAPPQWLLLEAHRLPPRRRPQPQPPRAPPGPQQQQREEGGGGGVHPVGAALMLGLGLEALGGSALAWVPPAAKAAAALRAVYLFRAGEMLPQAAHEDADASSEGSWREPLARWALAGLSARCLFGSGGTQVLPPGPPGPEWLPPTLAEALLGCLASSCFGDPLLAAHLAAALAAGGSPVVRLQVWNGLAAEQALHLLPPLRRCLGADRQYLPLPPTAPAATASGAGTAAAAAAASLAGAPTVAEPEPDPAFLAAAQRSLVEGDLERAMQPWRPHASPGPGGEAVARQGGGGGGGGGGGPAVEAVAAVDGCCSVAADVALQQLAGWLLVRDRWPALARAWATRPPEAAAAAAAAQQGGGGSGASTTTAHGEEEEGEGGREGSGCGGGAGRGVPIGAALLGGLVRTAAPEAVAALVAAGEARCGLARGEAAAVLAQTCGGDAELRERVRRVLVLCGLV